MTEIVAHDHWTWVGKLGPLTIEYNHRFEALAEGGTKITFVVSARGLGVSLLGRLFGALYRRDLERAIANLVRELDSATS